MKKFENLGKVLSKAEQKMILGGTTDACSMTYKDANGTWITEPGNCDSIVAMGALPDMTLVIPFCHTASFSGPAALTSNGGVSRCGAPELI